MIQEEMYSMREPFRRYTVEERIDTDVQLTEDETWKKQRDALQKLHERETMNLWKDYE